MYDECDAEGKRKHTVAQIAAEFGVTRQSPAPPSTATWASRRRGARVRPRRP